MKKSTVKAELSKDRVITENSDEAREFYNQSRFGKIMANGKVHLSLIEAFYLMHKKKMTIFDGRKKKLSTDDFVRRAKKHDKNFLVRCSVFRDIRDRGYIIKTALKFGADFRVYDRGVKPGEDHARWIVYPVHESSYMTWYEFAAKTRVAHSTRKRLMIGVVDDEGDVSYWEIKWTRP